MNKLSTESNNANLLKDMKSILMNVNDIDFFSKYYIEELISIYEDCKNYGYDMDQIYKMVESIKKQKITKLVSKLHKVGVYVTNYCGVPVPEDRRCELVKLLNVMKSASLNYDLCYQRIDDLINKFNNISQEFNFQISHNNVILEAIKFIRVISDNIMQKNIRTKAAIQN
jgi:uncharacterized protein YpuA (DUF1002 family)